MRDVASPDWPSSNGLTRQEPLQHPGASRGERRRLPVPKWDLRACPTPRPPCRTPVPLTAWIAVTTANQCYALDAGTGRQIWHYQRPRTKDLVGNAAGGVNRGVGVAGDRVFMVTDHAHIIALNRFTGALVWETEMADWHQNYNATGAPLPVGNLVISGTSGGDEGVRGLIAAFDQATGKKSGASGPSPRRASRDRKRGRAKASIIPPAARGSPARTIRSWTPSIGPSAIQDRISTAPIGPATTCTRARSWHSMPKPES